MGYFVPDKTQMLHYLEGIARLAPYYMWGADMEIITPDMISKKRKKFGDSHYDGRKFEEKIGYYGCDCSGLLTPIFGKDMTAKGWYSECVKNGTAGAASSAPSYALVFKGSSINDITHIGILIDGKTWEMYNRCDVKNWDKAYWKWYGMLPGMETNTIQYVPSGNTCRVQVKIPGYATAEDAVIGKKPAPATVIPGTYWIYKQTDKAINVTSSKGAPGCWIAK